MSRPIPRKPLLNRLNEPIEVFGIVHFGINTFTDREWGFGDEPPTMFNPSDFDPDQIVSACKAGGLQGLVIVCKHHDGFCLWPTKTTKHNITASPFAEKCPDYVKAMSDACRRAGIKCGFYVSPWDRNDADYATEIYRQRYWEQVHEIFDGRYGQAFEMWFDGANGGDGYYGGAREVRKIPKNYYDFKSLIESVRINQPQVCVMTDEDYGDFHWPGNEAGNLSTDARCTYPADTQESTPGWENKLYMGDINGTCFKQAECDFPIRPGWFYHEAENDAIKSPEYLLNRYLITVGNGGNMNIGVSPSKEGRLHENEVAALVGFGNLRKEFFADNCGDGVFQLDGEMYPEATKEFNCIVMQEDISFGEQIDGWELYSIDSNGVEHLLCSGQSIGVKRIRCFREMVTDSYIRFVVTKQDGEARPVKFKLYKVDQELLTRVLDAKEKKDDSSIPSFASLENAASDELVYKFECPYKFTELVVVPKTDSLGGTPVEFTLDYSADAVDWERIQESFRLDNVAANPIPQRITLSKVYDARYVRVNVKRTLKSGVSPILENFGIYVIR